MNGAACYGSGIQDHELYGHILAIDSVWGVERVELKLQTGEAPVYLCHGEQTGAPWPESGTLCRLYRHPWKQ